MQPDEFASSPISAAVDRLRGKRTRREEKAAHLPPRCAAGVSLKILGAPTRESSLRCKREKVGGVDGTRTRGLRRDRRKS
jgi:hypothetical protein